MYSIIFLLLYMCLYVCLGLLVSFGLLYYYSFLYLFFLSPCRTLDGLPIAMSYTEGSKTHFDIGFPIGQIDQVSKITDVGEGMRKGSTFFLLVFSLSSLMY